MDPIRSGSSFHLRGADGVRALACLAVIFHHLTQRLVMQNQAEWLQELQSFALAGSAGVSVFFVLSGFLLAFPFWSRYLNHQPYPSIKQYVIRRAARIMPGYYIAFLVTTLIVFLFHLPMEHAPTRILAGMFFLSGFHYVTLFPTEINGPLWSISFEVFCYLLMPIFMYVLFRYIGGVRTFLKGLMYWCGVFILILVLNQWVHLLLTPGSAGRGWEFGLVGGAKYWIPNYNPVGFFGHFTLGIIAAGVTARLNSITSSTKSSVSGLVRRSEWICLGSLALTLLLLWFTRHMSEFSMSLQNQPYRFPLLAILIAAILCTAPFTSFAAKLLDNRFLRFTAKVSFGLYVWHYLIISLISIVWMRDYQNSGMADFGKWAFVSFVVLAASYLIATLSYYFVEKPVLDRAHVRQVGQSRKNALSQ